MTDSEIYGCLSEPIRRFVYQKGWSSFRPIQRASIDRILSTDRNYILTSRTASGKTEAAFLPILSKVNFSGPGVKVLYISPLIALINDQMNRVEELCKYLDVTITKWHGEAKESAKRKLLHNPNGIVLITPESIQAMFDNHPENCSILFSDLKYVIIDEIHYFIGSDRGIQLQSLLARLQYINHSHFVTIGLSATIGDFTLAKQFVHDEQSTSVLLDSTRKPIDVYFHYFERENNKQLPEELIENLYKITKGQKCLIFPNSRGGVEETAVRLQQLAKQENNKQQYFSHHASVNRDLREYIEFFAKNSSEDPYAICCTSTLELGINIGNVDIICQVDATYSVSALVQRAGRSGRKDDAHAILHIFSTSPISMLRALACWNLHEEGKIESPQTISQPYDILLHQILSLTKEHKEIEQVNLVKIIRSIPVFGKISEIDINAIISHLLSPKNQVLENIDGKLIIGIDGEKLVNNQGFYSVFVAEQNMSVFANGKKIGELQPNPNIKVGKRLFLAAKIWRIDTIDYKKGKIFVNPDINGCPPKYEGNTIDISFEIEQEMKKIIFASAQYKYLDSLSERALLELRQKFSSIGEAEIPIEEERGGTNLYLFFGSKINRSISLLFDMVWSGGVELDDNCLRVPVKKVRLKESSKKAFAFTDEEVRAYLEETLQSDSSILKYCSKYGHLLPSYMQTDILMQKYYDLPAARKRMEVLL